MTSPRNLLKRIPAAIRRDVFERDGSICQMCGSTPNDWDPYEGTPTALTIGFVVDPERGGHMVQNNLRVICSCCSEGMRGVRLAKPHRIHLLGQVRRATIDDQEAVLNWLLGKFGLVAQKKS